MLRSLKFMKLGKFIFGSPSANTRITVVTFTGGMGAQIISAAIYFLLKSKGQPVFADLSYFDRAEHLAAVGKPGDCSHWSWQLDEFGLSRTSFEILAAYSKRDVVLIEDGLEKLTRGLKALNQPEIRQRFAISGKVEGILPRGWESGYLCVHVRRGDYVNVASHLVSDREFIQLAAKFSGLVKNIVVVSDSPIEIAFRQAISAGFEQAVFLDSIDAFASHRVMRNARILVCSNSQFSLVAAMLNPGGLVIIPSQWFGDKNRELEVPIAEACNFQIFGSG